MAVAAVKKKPVVKKAGIRKGKATRVFKDLDVYSDADWSVAQGELCKPVKAGRPRTDVEHLFRVVGEKLPYEALAKVKKHLVSTGAKTQGVYIAHDSMGCPRYVGRGNIFDRLSARKKQQPKELEYFSFYVVSEKKHEREVETLLIHAAGFLLEFNDRKKRVGLQPGSILDYEAGTVFYLRKPKKP
jgi:hypothetical protein